MDLTGSTIPRRYWSDLKIKLSQEGSEVYEKIVQLKMVAEDGKQRETDVADTETMFRIIQSIPSPKAEPFKLWLMLQDAGAKLQVMPEKTLKNKQAKK